VLLQIRSRDQQRFLALPIEGKADMDKDDDSNKEPQKRGKR
jgi:hypothetical protein